MVPENAIKILEEGCALLKQLNVTWWLSAGTALGAYRDKFSDEYLKRDTDIDVGVLCSNIPSMLDSEYKRIRGTFEEHDFQMLRCFKGNGYWTQLAFYKCGEIFDIYFFIDRDVNLESYAEEGVMIKPKSMIKDLYTVKIHDKEYPMPDPPEDYLKLRFGADWQQPKVKTTWVEGCANIRKGGVGVSDFFELMICRDKLANKPVVSILDANFGSRIDTFHPINFLWTRRYSSELTVFTDLFLPYAKGYDTKCKVAWLVEPQVIDPQIYDYVRDNIKLFDYVFTSDKSFISSFKDPVKFKYSPFGSAWVSEERGVKEKNLSIIASDKMRTDGHRLRHRIISNYKEQMDCYGASYTPLPNKALGLKPYRYSLIIENVKIPGYFTEKLIDPLLQGTIPVYWGDPDIGSLFDLNGFVILDNYEDLPAILPLLTEANYYSKIPFIEENGKRVKKYVEIENNLWEAGLKDLVKK